MGSPTTPRIEGYPVGGVHTADRVAAVRRRRRRREALQRFFRIQAPVRHPSPQHEPVFRAGLERA